MTPDEIISALERMMLIRAHEEAAAALQAAGSAPGTCTAVGGEASAVGVISALEPHDEILTNHRSAGHLLARGADPGRLLAEIMGRVDGYCRGRSGPLHVSARSLGVVLTSTIVGGELALAPGVALSRKMLDKGGIVVCFFGDGAACEGRFHESLNLSAVWALPVLYVCENNHWQAFVHRRETMRADTLAAHATAHGLEGATVDGTDVVAVYQAAKAARARIVETGLPYLLETVGYRLRGHFEPDDQGYVDSRELAHWKSLDPVVQLRDRLVSQGLIDHSMLATIEARVAAQIGSAAVFAGASPYPHTSALEEYVYA
jgi:acetoin:2,6-dichlorophenolindophenol oxidoreductase subunit alpha